ncbi:MAG: carboxylesterase family protein, partial [Mycobacterium sp.]
MNQVRVEQGILKGNQRNGVFRFRGIPFAAPPVGERRWAAPQPPPAWEGVRDATQFGNAAIQTVDTGVDLGAQPSEDCLYLNVWSPEFFAHLFEEFFGLCLQDVEGVREAAGKYRVVQQDAGEIAEIVLRAGGQEPLGDAPLVKHLDG